MNDLKMIMDFLDITDWHDCFWTDFEGKKHWNDVGYAYDFLKDLTDYIDSIGGMEVFKKRWTELKKKG